MNARGFNELEDTDYSFTPRFDSADYNGLGIPEDSPFFYAVDAEEDDD